MNNNNKFCFVDFSFDFIKKNEKKDNKETEKLISEAKKKLMRYVKNLKQ